jgi:SAM-dependent methyltransferase
MGTDKKTIKAYNANATKWSERLKNNKNLAHEYLEKPAMYAKLPFLRGKSVLCIGCGTGQECHSIRELGAKKVIGVDLASELVKIARRDFADIDFHVMDMEKLQFPRNFFDVIYSSLTIHYLKDWGKALAEAHRVLKPGGTFLFSTHHPVKWGAQIERSHKGKKFLMGYEILKKENHCTVFGDYFKTRKIYDTWFEDFTVVFYHKPISKIVREIIQSGFQMADMVEPKAIARVKKYDPAFFSAHQKIPTFMIFELRKRKL